MAEYKIKKTEIKNEAIKEANKLIEIKQKEHFKHLNKINRYNLQGYQLIHSKINKGLLLIIIYQILIIVLLVTDFKFYQ